MKSIGLLAALFATVFSFNASAVQLAPPSGYVSGQLLAEDQFTGTSLDTTKWQPWLGQNGGRWCDYQTYCALPSPYSGETLRTGSAYNFDAEYYDPYPAAYSTNTSGNHLVTGSGGLQIIASKSSHFTGSYYGVNGFTWASAAISSTGKSMVIPATGGYLQISAKLPDMTQGAWPAIWLLSENGSGSAIDFEFGYSGSAGPNRTYQISWCCDTTAAVLAAPSDLSQAYHTYGLEYRPASSSSTNDGKITFYLDGVQVGSYASNQTGAYEVILVLQMAQNASGWHAVVSGTTTGPYTMYVNDAQIYSLKSSTTTTDTTAPSVPSGLTATAVTSAEVDLAWNASTDNVGVAAYDIYRNGTWIGYSLGTTYADKTVAVGNTYSYTVVAYDAAKNQSAQSAAVSVTTGTFATGAAVATTASTSVMSRPGRGATLCTQAAGINGTILQGPKTYGGVTWWYVGFDAGCDGWVPQSALLLN